VNKNERRHANSFPGPNALSNAGADRRLVTVAQSARVFAMRRQSDCRRGSFRR